jgi:hypothetical protein
MKLSSQKMTTVANIPEGFQFVSDSQDVAAIKATLSGDQAEFALGYDAFFVKLGEGEYEQIYGMVGIVPRLTKLVSQVHPFKAAIDRDQIGAQGMESECGI